MLASSSNYNSTKLVFAYLAFTHGVFPVKGRDGASFTRRFGQRQADTAQSKKCSGDVSPAESAAGTPLSGASTSVEDASRVKPVIYNSGG